MSSSTQPLFTGFEPLCVDVGDGVRIAAVVGGTGSPLLLLHGHPQTHAIWHRVAPALAERHYIAEEAPGSLLARVVSFLS